MVEFVGAAAALTQLAKYSIELANGAPEFARRLRQAPVLARQWNDHATLLVGLGQTMQSCGGLTDHVTVDILDRCKNEADELHLLLRDLAIATGDGRLVKVKKKISIIWKEKEIERLLLSIGQRSDVLQKHALLLHVIRKQPSLRTIQRPVTLNGSIRLPSSSSSQNLVTPRNTRFIGSIRRNSNFVGQASLLDTLSKLVTTACGSCVALCGLGGVGKSELVVEFAYQLQLTSQDLSIFFIDGTTEEQFVTDFRKIGREAQPTGLISASNIDTTIVHSWLNSGESGRWLMIIDNVDLETLFGSEQLHKLLPNSPHGCVLITTRNRQLGLKLAHPRHLIDMQCMHPLDAKDLLLSFTGFSHGSEADASTLVSALDYIPFAIVQAGFRIISSSISIEQYLRAWNCDKIASDLFMVGSIEFVSAIYRTVPSSSIVLSATTVQHQSPEAIPLMCILACLGPHSIPTELTSKLELHGRMKQPFETLKAYFIIESHPSDTAINMNRIARAAIRAQLKGHPQRVHFLECALRLVASLSLLRLDSSQSIAQGHLYSSHIESVLDIIMNIVPENHLSLAGCNLFVTLATWFCRYLLLMGCVQRAADLLKIIFQWGARSFYSDSENSNSLRVKVAIAELAQGRFNAAQQIMLRVLRSQIHTMGNDHAETLHTLNNLGVIYEDQGLHQKAEKYHLKALSMKEQLFGRQHLDTLISVNNLALSLQSQKKHSDAEMLFRRALYGRRRLLNHDHVDLFVSMSNLGVSLQLQGRFNESKDLHETALAGRERILGQQHHETLKSKGNLALTLHSQGQYDTSNDLMREVHNVYEEILGAKHPDTIRALRNLGILLQKQNKLQEAEDIISEVLILQEEEFGKGHEETFSSLQYIATLLHLQSKHEEALDMARWLLDARCETLGLLHQDTASSLEHVRELEGIVNGDLHCGVIAIVS